MGCKWCGEMVAPDEFCRCETDDYDDDWWADDEEEQRNGS